MTTISSKSGAIFFALLLFFLDTTNATIYIHNERDFYNGNSNETTTTFDSLPALFGRYMHENRIYDARLQFSHTVDPYLCDYQYNLTDRHLFPPQPMAIVTKSTNKDYNNMKRLIPVPSAMLAPRGECSFLRKAQVASMLDPRIEFLIVYNLPGDDAELLPLYSEYGDTRLVLLSVSHSTGNALKRWLVNQTDATVAKGGPLFQLDGTAPAGLMTVQELQDMVISALGFLLFIIFTTSCTFILCNSNGGIPIFSSRIVLTSSGPIAIRTLLTAQEVYEISRKVESSDNEVNDDDSDSGTLENSRTIESSLEDQDNSCAVCIEELNDRIRSDSDSLSGNNTAHNNNNTTDNPTITLPCHHRFHADCIIPWLTERQAHCPLCKYNVLDYINNNNNTGTGSDELTDLTRLSWWDCITRYRWSRFYNEATTEDWSHAELELAENSNNNNAWT